MADSTRRRFLSQVGAGVALPVFCGWSRTGRPPRLEIEAIAAKLSACSTEAAFATAIALARDGATWNDILGATLLVAAREVRPAPIGNDAHSIMMIESAFQLATQAAPEQRLLPVLFNLDYVKRSQHRDDRWSLPAPREDAKLPAKEAADLFTAGMRNWRAEDADRSLTSLCANLTQAEVFELIWPYALRDFRFLGHKPIYAAAIYRSLARIGWQHGLPLLRSMVVGLLDGFGENPLWTATYTSNRQLARTMKVDWTAGQPDPEASFELAAKLRRVAVDDAGPLVAEWLGRGVAAPSIWDGLRLYAAEVLMQQRGIAGVHLTTSIHALHFIWQTTRREPTKRLALLQAASWMPLFRDDFTGNRGIRLAGPGIDTLQADETALSAAEVLAVDPSHRESAARQAMRLACLGQGAALEDAVRQLVFAKGNESHFYKYAAAMFEEARCCHRELAPRVFAAGVLYLPVGGVEDARVYTRARAALQKL